MPRILLALALLAALGMDPVRTVVHATTQASATRAVQGRAAATDAAHLAGRPARARPAVDLPPGVSSPMVTNLTTSGFTVVFTTGSEDVAWVNWGFSPTSMTTMATDDRGPLTSSTIHSITISASGGTTGALVYYQLVIDGTQMCGGAPPFSQQVPGGGISFPPFPWSFPTGLLTLSDQATPAPQGSTVLIAQVTAPHCSVSICASWPISVLTRADIPDARNPHGGSDNYNFGPVMRYMTDSLGTGSYTVEGGSIFSEGISQKRHV